MPDRIEDLMMAFRRERQREESPEKLAILSELEGSEEDRVTAFLLEIASNESEYDLARIEALKALQFRSIPEPERLTAAHAIARVLRESEDPNVRNYAALALSSFLDVDGMLQVMAELLLDPDEDPSLRHNAFFALERHGPTYRSLDLLRKVVNDPELGAGAERLLKKWSGPEFA